MRKVFLEKFLLSLTFLLLLSQNLHSQEKFSLIAQLLVDKKVINDADVVVFNGQNVFSQTKTNKLGKFSVDLRYQEIYVLQFKKAGLPVLKVVLSTKIKKVQSETTKSKVMVLTLLSTKPSDEGPGIENASASYQINENGLVEQGSIDFSDKIKEQEKQQIAGEKKIEALSDNIGKELNNLDSNQKKLLLAKYEAVNTQVDSLLFMAYKQSSLILQNANMKSEEIVDNAYFKFPEIIKEREKKSLSSETEIKNELKKLALDEEEFNKRDDIKVYKSKLKEFGSKPNGSKKDSVEYLETMVMFREEMVKSARMQIEIDKLNIRTRQDSIELQKREAAISTAEKEIQQAKDKIEIQKLEIRQKNTMLMFSISATLFFIILSLLVYNSFRHKKKTNIILEKQNIEIANKNKKIIDSINYAQTIQQAILPMKSSIDKYFSWFVIYQPKDIVSGDFYWFNHFEDSGKSVFAVVDCTGHGVPGAFMSMIGSRLLIETVKEKGITRPDAILDEVDAMLKVALMQEETSNNDGMDVGVCTIEYLKGNRCKLEFAGAKRPMFYTDSKNKKVVHLKGTVRGIGGKKRLRNKPVKPFESHTIEIDKGEMVYLTTDGFFDLQSPSRKKFGRVNFMKLLEQHMAKPLNIQQEELINALHIHKGSEFQIDDITILGIKT
ncbi:MAG: SpoIIE family protein phosphatase [Bacteroidales bacterium]